jgi:hypothetical protein
MATILSQLTPGQSFRVAGANVRMRLVSIDVGPHAATVRVENLDTRIGYVYCWANDTPVYNVV